MVRRHSSSPQSLHQSALGHFESNYSTKLILCKWRTFEFSYLNYSNSDYSLWHGAFQSLD